MVKNGLYGAQLQTGFQKNTEIDYEPHIRFRKETRIKTTYIRKNY